MKNTLLAMALISSAVLGALAGGGIVAHRDALGANAKPAFDYETCTVIAAKGGLDHAPETPDWKSMETTPGGNWCIRTR